MSLYRFFVLKNENSNSEFFDNIQLVSIKNRLKIVN